MFSLKSPVRGRERHDSNDIDVHHRIRGQNHIECVVETRKRKTIHEVSNPLPSSSLKSKKIKSTYWPSVPSLFGEKVTVGLDFTDLAEAAWFVLPKPQPVFSPFSRSLWPFTSQQNVLNKYFIFTDQLNGSEQQSRKWHLVLNFQVHMSESTQTSQADLCCVKRCSSGSCVVFSLQTGRKDLTSVLLL